MSDTVLHEPPASHWRAKKRRWEVEVPFGFLGRRRSYQLVEAEDLAVHPGGTLVFSRQASMGSTSRVTELAFAPGQWTAVTELEDA